MNIKHFQEFSKTLGIFSPQDFSRPGNNYLKIPGLFQVFHDRTNPGIKLHHIPTVRHEHLVASPYRVNVELHCDRFILRGDFLFLPGLFQAWK